MYNLIEYSSNYSETTGSLWFYSKDEATDFNADIVNDNNSISFKYKVELFGNTVAQVDNATNTKKCIKKSLKYLSNFWRSLEMQLINCKVELKLKRSNYCLLSAAGNDSANGNDDNSIFTIKTQNYMFQLSLYQQETIKN